MAGVIVWTHKDGTDDHIVDPHYNGRAAVLRPDSKPAYWTCHVKGCDRLLLANRCR